jgi:hypothetical protein
MKPIRTTAECIAMARLSQAKRTDPAPSRRIDQMPLRDAIRLWRDRVEVNWMKPR